MIQLDVLPTALAAAGVRREVRMGTRRGRPAAAPDRQATGKAPHDTLYWRLGGQAAVRRGDWKLVRYDGTVDTPGARSDAARSRR